MRLSSQRGSTLMEMMVVIPLALLLVFGMSVALQELFEKFQGFKAKSESLMAQDFLRSSFMTPATCSSHLQNSTREYNPSLAGAGKLPLAFSLGDGDDVAQTGAILTKYGLRVDSLTYRVLPEGVNYMLDPLIGGNTLQYGLAVIETSKISNGVEVKNAPQILSGLVLSVDPSRKISRCFILDDTYDLCGAVGGHLYATGGKTYCYAGSPCINQLLSGFDGLGNAICKGLDTLVAESCPADQFLVSNGAGGANCSPIGGPPPPIPPTDPTAVVIPPPPPGSPVSCLSSSSFPGAGPNINIESPPVGGTGCFYTELGVHVIVTRKAGGIWEITPGPVPHPLYPFSKFTVGKMPDGNPGVSAPNGSYMSGI